eukprot:TRINITY_DN16725_c0_g1_i1.p1 TRINITY_DN16725_c0_g1~~TRINITY_DN16725_c0_g1_i1.p1  ORF type:complete len:127 (-),score=36.10 TRINITY_DN16725_c0_g1_i1:193-552(-)
MSQGRVGKSMQDAMKMIANQNKALESLQQQIKELRFVAGSSCNNVKAEMDGLGNSKGFMINPDLDNFANLDDMATEAFKRADLQRLEGIKSKTEELQKSQSAGAGKLMEQLTDMYPELK